MQTTGIGLWSVTTFLMLHFFCTFSKLVKNANPDNLSFFSLIILAEISEPHMVSSEQLPNENLSVALDQKIVSPNRVLADTSCLAQVIVGFPDLMVRLY